MTDPKSQEVQAAQDAQEIADGERRYRDAICGDEFRPLDLGMSPDIDED